jgi:DNA-directed RNA polymerase subunit RPC12/RpoP
MTAIKCPVCSKPTESLKRYTLLDKLVFIWVAAWTQRRTYAACPDCMRRIVLKNTFSWNILLANLLWLIVILPYNVALLIASGTQGHSKSVKKMLDLQ